ncbi:MAG: DUF2834 domain-containing protein [Acidobacteria bacterium]|nr:DUF2834 domain-containing protein [Acidobacteriota bacterium]
MKKLYLILTLVGLVAPYILIVKFTSVHGLDLGEFWRQMWASYISSMAMTDLLLSCFIFWIYIRKEASKYKINNLWIYVSSTLAIGLCFALPLFLYVRESKKELLKN